MTAATRRTIGRARELSLLDTFVRDLFDGVGSVCVIEGEPGIGKSQLVVELRARADAVGIPTFVGYGEPLERGRPMHVLTKLLPGGVQAVATADGRPPALEPLLSDRYVMQEAAVAEIERLARRPVVVVAEDVQWADDASLLTLIESIRLSETQPIGIVLTCRMDPRGEALVRTLDVVRRRPDHVWIEPAPLGPGETRALAAEEVSADQLAGLGDSLAAAGGNPFFVIELAHAWAGGHRTGSAGVALEHISHLHHLEPEVVGCLRAASVLGTRFELSTLSAVTDRPVEEVGELLGEAARAAIVSFDQEGVTFRHDLIREAMYANLPKEVRGAHHRRAAEHLLRSGSPAVQAAEHLLIGAVDGDARAAEALVEAAASLVTVDPARSLVLIDRADEIDQRRSFNLRAPWLEARIRALAAVGRLDEALALGRGIAAMGETGGRDILAEVLAGLALIGNRPTDALAELGRARRAAGDPIQRVRIDAQASLTLMVAGDQLGAFDTATSAAADASTLGDPAARSLALSVQGRLFTLDHGYERAREVASEAVAAADLDPSSQSHRWLPWFFAGLTALDLDDITGVEMSLAEGRHAAQRAGTPWAEPLYAALAASAAMRVGNLDDARSLAESAVELSLSFESTQAVAWAHATASLAAFEAGDVDTAVAQSVAATAAAESGSMLGADHVVRAAALLAEYHGQLDEAFELLFGAWQVFEAMGVLSCQPVLGPDLVRVAVRLGRDDVAIDVAATMDDVGARVDVPWIRACRLRCVGLANGDVEMLTEAAAAYRSTPRRLEQAQILVELAGLAAIDDRPALLDQADALFEACGARRGVGDASESGLSSDTRSSNDLDGLTVTERAIVELVCEGLTNTEVADRRVVSRRTVESHLARVYRKLGVRTRSQLVVMVTRPHRSE